MNELKKVIDTLDEASDGFDAIANKEQKKIYDEVVTLIKDLDVDALGRVRQSISNLKRLTQIKANLSALSKNKEWVAGISKFLQYFSALQKQQNDYFSTVFPKATLNESAKEKNDLLRKMAIQNTTDALMGSGLKANVTDKINDILLRAVTSNAKFADLQEELRAHLLGKDGGQGAFARYATTYATTALSQYTGQHNKLVTDDLGTQWFMYVGSNKETTREFCEQLTKKKYIHRSEIRTILTGKIDEYQCDIYPKTGLPYGMIEGTTEENFQCNCGGWNCRHQLIPVADAVVPAELREKFAKARPSSEDISQKVGRQAFFDLLKYNGWDDDSIKTTMKDLVFYGVKFDLSETMTASQNSRAFQDAQIKMANKQIELHQKWSSLDSIWSILHSNFPDKFRDVAEFYAKYKDENNALTELGYDKTIEWVNKTRRRIEGSIDRMADIETSGSKNKTNTYSRSELSKGAKLLQAKLGEKMEFSKADSGNVNPGNERLNCQRCAMTFELRCRGLEVSAGKIKTGHDDFFDGMSDVMGDECWINTKTKQHPVKHYVRKSTFEETEKAFNAATNSAGRYILYCIWERGGAHNFNFIRNSRGVGFFYDGQINKTKTLKDYYNRTHKGADYSLSVWRVDDCDLEPRYYSTGGVFSVKND